MTFTKRSQIYDRHQLKHRPWAQAIGNKMSFYRAIS